METADAWMIALSTRPRNEPPLAGAQTSDDLGGLPRSRRRPGRASILECVACSRGAVNVRIREKNVHFRPRVSVRGHGSGGRGDSAGLKGVRGVSREGGPKRW